MRLGVFLLRREFQQSYRKELAAVQEETKQIPEVVKVTIWLVVALLYTMMFSPCLFNFEAGGTIKFTTSSLVQSTGLIIMLFGFGLESLADHQKSAFKKSQPQRFCDVGLYRWVRSPNYLGEILFWFGNWVAGYLAFDSVLKWAISTFGLIGIIFIMLISTRRLEIKQSARYGEMTEYQSYIPYVPILFPSTNLYSMEFLDWLPFT